MRVLVAMCVRVLVAVCACSSGHACMCASGHVCMCASGHVCMEVCSSGTFALFCCRYIISVGWDRKISLFPVSTLVATLCPHCLSLCVCPLILCIL